MTNQKTQIIQLEEKFKKEIKNLSIVAKSIMFTNINTNMHII
jgi:hypothetical protein